MSKGKAGVPGEVRIIGGRWRRSKLPVPDLPGLRPTGDRLRETLFNWLGQELGGWRVLDAFAGSGALGLEAASRGAQVTLVEQDPRALRSLRDVVSRLDGAADCVRVLAGDAFGQIGPGWDLVLLDPPFEADLFERALNAACGASWIYLESPCEFAAPEGYRLHRHLKAGAVYVHLFAREN